ncbi:AbrB family transcriptional regulator [Nesterenkonia halotolerans]|uniref:Membrane AbrB-like protein n=1 Tax=Nesterenkonia halotolerans TaxID=225325 RepID=A0ABR9J8G7_9MICC|nr:AbrB family transcriptional regulator [Nesterenkonia halotolerans]MBE1514871.1 membrane AbrB-like protein [Nesterenkonia halotolerans]
MSELLPLLAVMAGSATAAMLFRWWRMPLWPLTGGLLGAAAVNLGFGLAVQVPNLVVLLAQLLVGTAIGATIAPDTFRQFRRFLAPGALAVGAVLGAGVLFGWAFAALGILEPAESMLSLMPGGVAEMVTAGVALGFDGAVIIGAHMVRLFTVLLSLPLVLWVAASIHRRWIADRGTPDPETPSPETPDA